MPNLIMVMLPLNPQLAQVVHRLMPQSRLLRSWPLKGGVSAQVTALEIEQPDGQLCRLVIRQHGEADRQRNPQIAAHEFRLLQALRCAGLPVPTPYAFDESGTILPTPYVLVEFIDGAPEFAPADPIACARQLAEQLAQIHNLDLDQLDLSFLAQHPAMTTYPVSELLGDERLRATLTAVWPLSPLNAPVLLHGDFWPGNVLWRDGQVAAVMDWEDAAVGDSLIDLANSRLEILWAFGVEAMKAFKQHYQTQRTLTNITQLPYWDLFAAQRSGAKLGGWRLDTATETRLRGQLHLFITQALEML
ncbi:MAG TPA: phosphotransferase family protein [Phototrophicaceae bacterium]|nr:phosphotransferase family protein [Phototrophicaceae bacterium]